jgi:hypothetical protein
MADPVPGDQAGVFADGSITSRFFICTTCTPVSELLEQQEAGGFGNNGPAIVGDSEARGTGTAMYGAQAVITGTDLVPELKAIATATPGVGPHTGFNGDGAYFFTSSSTARVDQYYSYHGLTPETYTISYVIEGRTHDALPVDDPFVTVTGGLAVFDDGDKLGGELPKGREVDSSQKSFNGASETFLDGGSVSITVNSGASFYLSSFLSATVTGQAEGVADARDTFTTSFTAGDTSLLTALLPASVVPPPGVPEPSTYVMCASGFALLAFIRRRTQSADRRPNRAFGIG